MGAGGSQLYYKGLIDKLGVDVHVFRVGKFKSYVEPYTRTDKPPEAAQADRALYGTIFDQWQEAVKKARPKAQIAPSLTEPAQVVTAAGGHIAQAHLKAWLVDKLATRPHFGQRLSRIPGAGRDRPRKHRARKE